MLNIAHRGARSVAPENTLAAAERAHRDGADMWEFDIRSTKDNEIVLFHDESLMRTTDVEEVYPDRSSYRVREFTLTEIRRLDAGSWFCREDPFGEIERGGVSDHHLSEYRQSKVPTLREALELTRELAWRANLEIKPRHDSGTPESKLLIRRTVSLLEELGLEDEVIVSSFEPEVVRELERLNPRIPSAILIKEPVADPVKFLEQNGARFLNIAASALESEQGVANVEKIGNSGEFGVIVWTVAELEGLKKFVANPFIDGIITDYPDRLKELVGDVRFDRKNLR